MINLDDLKGMCPVSPALVGAGVIVLAFSVITLWGYTMRLQRNVARLECERLELTIDGYRLAARAQAAELENAVAVAKHMGESTKVLISSLGNAPQSDEAARVWALGAAGRIGK